MSEGNNDASVLIATSFQALNRVIAIDSNPDRLITDCTVLVLFAGFYVEATLNHIFEQTGKEEELRLFPATSSCKRKKNHPGLRDKLVWFYNEFVEQTKATNWTDLNHNDIDKKLNEKFPGFSDLYKFRNDISHGHINQSAKSLDTAQLLRQQAKDIVNQLYIITTDKGYVVSRDIKYRDALASFDNNKTIVTTKTSAS